MADMNALVADAENYLHVGAMDANGKLRVDPEKFGNFNNGGEMDDSFYQVNYLKNGRGSSERDILVIFQILSISITNFLILG